MSFLRNVIIKHRINIIFHYHYQLLIIYFVRFRLPGRAKYQTKEEVLEGIYIDSTASCFGAINAQREDENHLENTDHKSEKEDAVSRNESHHSRSISGSWPNLNDDLKQTNLSEDSIGHSRNPSEIDSLDSNYVRKHYNFDAHLKNYKDSSPETERSVVSPDNNKHLYITDHDTDQEDRDRSKNNTPKSFTNDSLSITQSDKDKKESAEPEQVNDVDSYDEISIRSKISEGPKNSKPEDKAFEIRDSKKDEDSRSVLSENDGTISSPPDSITSYISISIASSTDKSHKLEYLANSLAEKIDEYCEAQFKENISVASNTLNSENNNTESDPIYTKVNKKKTFADIRRDSFHSNKSNIFNEIPKKHNNEVFVTNTYIENDNFSTKSNCTSTKNITTEPFVTTLIENQYYSLPDINISKCLRKSERIDAQLREEDQEDIPCENTYEIAQTHFREILLTKGNENYGQLNKTNVINNQNLHSNTSVYLSDYREPQAIESFTKLEDDLKSIITIDSSNTEDKDNNFFPSDSHQNEREINEIEGTIRNNKVITKSESLKLTSNSNYRPDQNISKSFSHDNINKSTQQKKAKQGIRKHYSLRQRDPTDDDIHRLPSPSTVQRSLNKSCDSKATNIVKVESNSTPLLSRVQSFKTSADSNIAIVPLSGHQTLVIDPPLTQNLKDNCTKSIQKLEIKPIIGSVVEPVPILNSINKVPEITPDKKKENQTTSGSVDNSSYWIPKDPFITIKLNKVVKTSIPKLKKDSCEKIAGTQYKFEKPPPRLIIKDNKQAPNNPIIQTNKQNAKMTRPQVLQVTDSKTKKAKEPMKTEIQKNETAELRTDMKSELLEEIRNFNNDRCVKEKLNNAIKTDIEYQEKLHSVKNYWSKLIDKSPDVKDNGRTECKLKTNESSQVDKNIDSEKNTVDEPDCSTDVSVGSIVKSLETVKIVDSIRKISQTKLQLWKDESEKLKSDSEIEETAVKKIAKDCEGNYYEKPKPTNTKSELELCRDTPEIEIVELSSDDNHNHKTQATLIKAKGFDKGCDEFDHVRYKVMKSELFKNSMIANYRKEAQFDGLLQYLQDYSFQELLVNNNIVIIEPVRTKVEPMSRNSNNQDTRKIPPTLLKKNENSCSHVDRSKNAIRRHFFYHPIRVNKEIIEEELPNPDTVKKVRNLFEDTLKMKSPMTMTQDPPLVEETIGLTRRATSYRNLNEESKGSKLGGRKKVIRQLTIDTNFGHKKWDNASLSSGVSSGDLSSNNDYETDGLSPYPNKNLKDNVYSSSDEYLCDSVSHDFCCESQYVSPDIMKKIRECGTTVTYYGGKVLNSKPGSTVSPMTKAIMDEIKGLQKNCSRDCYSCQSKCRGEKCSCLVADKHKQIVQDKQSSNASSDSGNPESEKNKRSEGFPGFKFKLVKSNSCSSRLELTGTDDNKIPRMKYRSPSKQLKADDPPLVNDDENSVKNKICRLESYNKGVVKTPFEKKDNEDKKIQHATINKLSESILKKNLVRPQVAAQSAIINREEKQEPQIETTEHEASQNDPKLTTDPHSFEKKYYYVNENLEQSNVTPGKFGEMVFEEFEVLESCYDSLNSNKSLK